MKFTFDELNTLFTILEVAIQDNEIHRSHLCDEFETAEDTVDKAFWKDGIDRATDEIMELNDLRHKIKEMMKNTRNL